MSADAVIPARLLSFLSELRVTSDRACFQANKPRFEADLRDPCLGFIRSLEHALPPIIPVLLPDARPVGGSLFRIYKDTRFSKDKAPYKTHAGIHIRHRGSQDDVHGPGLYINLEPGKSMIGVGIWRPEPASLAAIRRALVAEPDRWAHTLTESGFSARFRLEGESLKRVPAGLDPGHPLAETLRRKDHIAVADYSDAEVLAPQFFQAVLEDARRSVSYVRLPVRVSRAGLGLIALRTHVVRRAGGLNDSQARRQQRGGHDLEGVHLGAAGEAVQHGETIARHHLVGFELEAALPERDPQRRALHLQTKARPVLRGGPEAVDGPAVESEKEGERGEKGHEGDPVPWGARGLTTRATSRKQKRRIGRRLPSGCALPSVWAHG